MSIGKNDFRMTRNIFVEIVTIIQPVMEKRDIQLRRAITKEKRVAIALWQLSTRNSFRKTAKTFTIGKPAAVQITPDVCSEIKRLANGFIKFPSTRRATTKAIKKFRILCRCQIPQALGAFDCTHISIKTLSVQGKADCHSRKHCRTISTQATVGANLVFLDVTTGFPGS